MRDAMSETAPKTFMLSVIVPVFNEAENLGPLLARLRPVLEKETQEFEVIFVDDGSSDAGMEEIRRFNGEDGRLRAVSLSRNFGKEVAIAAGLDAAQGDAVIIMDADLQHPPEVIPQFVRLWREGHAVVYGQRRDRAYEGKLKRGFSRLFYEIFARLGETQLPEEAGDFRLFDRRAVEALRLLGERSRFSKGLYSWIGFKSIGVPFEVGERLHGKSRYNYRKLLHFAWDGIASFTTVPLRIWTYLGFLISLGAILTGLYFIGEALFVGVKTPGFPTLIVAVTLLAGVQLMSLGMIGEYVGRIFAEVKRRPLYIVAERVGLAAGPQRSGAPPAPVPQDKN
jgi:glycosyltransferase involved in cell wall biosynthesis